MFRQTDDLRIAGLRALIPPAILFEELLRAISPRHNPTQQTLDRLLRPFGLRLSVKAIAASPKKRAV